jgi:dUTP pyrophosphatase
VKATVRVRVRRIGAIEVPLPSYQTALAAGMDLCAALDAPCELLPGQRRVVPTGLALAIPEGYEGQVRPRSGLGLRHGIGIINAPGTIDADYRGEVRVVLINLGSEPYLVRPLDRIAQLVIAPVVRAELELRDDLDPTERGSGGYGSTGR